MKQKGMVVKIKSSYCIILARDGTYYKLPLPRAANPKVGAETEFTPPVRIPYLKYVMIAASFLILVAGFGLYRSVIVPPAFAYVSLDINPSVELEIDEKLKVLQVRFLNNEAAETLAALPLKNSDLYTSVNLIITEAVRHGYIKPGQTNYVLSTVTASKSSDAKLPAEKIDYHSLTRNLEQVTTDKDLDIEIIVMSGDLSLRSEAKNKDISTGKLAVYKDAVAAGEKLTLEQVRQTGLAKLVDEYNINLTPKNRESIRKSVHISPAGQNKKSRQNEDRDFNDDDDNREDVKTRDKEEKEKEKENDRKNSREDNRENSRNNIREKSIDKTSKNNRDNNTEKDKENIRDNDTENDREKDRDEDREKDREKDRDADKDEDRVEERTKDRNEDEDEDEDRNEERESGVTLR